MGVPHFYTWLINRYPLIKSPYNQSTLPNIDWLFIDLNSIVCKCVLGEPSSFKGVVKTKRCDEICIQVFNCVNEITQLIHPQKMLYLTLDGVLPKAKLNQERTKRFKSAKKYSEHLKSLRDLDLLEDDESFNLDEIQPGTEFMDELNEKIKFLIMKKMKEDERWRKLPIYFSGSKVPGDTEHKILQFIRSKAQEPNFNPNTTICIYGADPNWMMLSLTLHLPFVCIIREQCQAKHLNCLVTKSCQQQTLYDFLWINILRDYLEAEFAAVKEKVKRQYSIDKIIDDLFFLYILLQNDFLPRLFCMDVNINNMEKILEVFKEILLEQEGFINNKGVLVWDNFLRLLKGISKYELKFINDKAEEQQSYQHLEKTSSQKVEEITGFDIQSNNKVLQEVKELKEEYEELERLEKEEEDDELSGSSQSEDEEEQVPREIKRQSNGLNTPPKTFHRKSGAKKSLKREGDYFQEDLERLDLENSNSSDSTSKSDNENNNFHNYDEKEEDKRFEGKSSYEQQQTTYSESYSTADTKGYIEDSRDKSSNSGAKIEEPQNFLAEQSQEESLSRFVPTGVLENDIRFITSLVKAFKKSKLEAQKLYYEDKFKINLAQDYSQMTPILISYIQGLQFLMSYYYAGCPSWQWSYPYNFSPLLSDLSNLIYLPNFVGMISSLINFELGEPFDPYKQLLYTLPLSSLYLLPEALRISLLKIEQNLLQFYPQDFQLDPFGGVFYNEYIPKIPLIEQKILDIEYQKALIESKLSDKEKRRNKFEQGLVYEWDASLQDYEIESLLPSHFENFRAQVKIDKYNFGLLPIDPTKIFDKPPHGTYKYHKSYPSLYFIQDKLFEMKSFCQQNTTFCRCCIRLGQRLNLTDYKQYRKLLDQPFYCMYPFLVPCFVMGIVTPDQLITNVDYQNLPFSYKKAKHRDYYLSLSRNVHQFYLMQMGVLFKESLLNFALIYLETEPRKDALGNIYSPKPRIETIPLNFLIDTNIMPLYRGRIDYSVKDILKEFALHTEVIINIGPPAGSLAKVVGYTSEAYDFDQVEVKIVKAVPKLDSFTSAIASKYNDHRRYKSLYNVSKRLGVDLQVIFTILDCLFVKTETVSNEKTIYPERFDIGLNLIQRTNQTIVPELVICNELKKFGKARNRTFPHYQLSPGAVVLVQNYFQHHKSVFEAIANKIRMKDPHPLTSKEIFPNSEDPNVELFKVYCWILKQESSNLSLTNKASKVIPREGVKELETLLVESRNYLGDQAKNILNKVFPYNPNFIIPKYLDNWVPPFFSRQPPWHKLGDRVVNLKVNGYNFAPFGTIGTVVGILGNKPENGFLKIKIEVLFDYPFIGGTNLGGRCNWGRGAVVNFDDIFNLTRWEKCIKGRDPKKAFKNTTWDGVFPKSYLPSFQTASEASETEEEITRLAQKNVKKIPIIAEDLIKKLTTEKRKADIQTQPKYQQQKPRNKTRSQSRNKNPQKYQRKAPIVPKTLGLRKSTDQSQNPVEIPQSMVPSESSKPEVIKNNNQESQNKSDFSSLISSTLTSLHVDINPSSPYSQSHRYPLNKQISLEKINGGILEDTSNNNNPRRKSSGMKNSESNVQKVRERENFEREKKEELTKANEFEDRTTQLTHPEKVEISRKVEEQKVASESIKDLGQRFFISYEKESKKTKVFDANKEVEINELEEYQKVEVSVEVSLGGRIVKDGITYFENSEQEIGG